MHKTWPLVSLLAISLTACTALAQSPEQKPVPTDGIYPDVIEHPMPEDLSQFKQPATLVADLKAIQTGSLEGRLAALEAKSKRDQVFVEGGTFQMGDFGPLQSEEELPWDGNSHSSPLHEVTLDSYSISKYKVTVAEFDLYAEAADVSSVLTEERFNTPVAGNPPVRQPNKPATGTWYQAKAYCQWLGKQTGLPFDLPTEAQWEFAARDRGRFIVYPTNNGKLEWNINVPTLALADAINKSHLSSTWPVGLFPPTSMGLHGLAIHTLEWVQDWYAADYYYDSDKAENPQGPDTGTEKVQRSWPITNSRAAMTMTRRHKAPKPPTDKNRSSTIDGFRCAVQSPEPVTSP